MCLYFWGRECFFERQMLAGEQSRKNLGKKDVKYQLRYLTVFLKNRHPIFWTRISFFLKSSAQGPNSAAVNSIQVWGENNQVLKLGTAGSVKSARKKPANRKIDTQKLLKKKDTRYDNTEQDRRRVIQKERYITIHLYTRVLGIRTRKWMIE